MVIIMEKYNKSVGNVGENFAISFLKKNKYKIIDKNFSCKLGEIDIIARNKNFLVFIEVKTRKDSEFGLASLAVTHQKRKKISNTAQYYLMKNKHNLDIRFDIIEVYVKVLKDEIICEKISHIENAFGYEGKIIWKPIKLLMLIVIQ